MNPDELIWRIAEAEELLKDCDSAADDPVLHNLISARVTALKNELAYITAKPALGQEQRSAAMPELPDQDQLGGPGLRLA